MKESDFLVLGSGIAGLSFAIKIAECYPDKQVVIVTKSSKDESNTKYAQGGIAVVMNQINDNFQKHIEDTLICGDGLCDENVVKMVVTQGPKRVKELIDWGTQFDKNQDGFFDLGKEGGHTTNRVMHYKDQTGYEIERAILNKAHLKKNIEILDFHFAIDLITIDNVCYGAKVLDEKTNEIVAFKASYTILATGGIGQVYGHTTNPEIATGDGIAMAKRAKALISDMEFIQFHPTALYCKNQSSTFLISEAVRGFGAYLRNKKGRRFMFDCDKRGELASRDIVSKCIENEIKKSTEECVYLDCTHLDMKKFKAHFPMIYERCKLNGIEIENNWIPVIPAQHYVCGGIRVDADGKTSIENLFACGECSQTGLHGANRLASNSLLEAIVYSERIFNYLKENFIDNPPPFFYKENRETKSNYCRSELLLIKKKMQTLMRRSAGIIRNNDDLMKSQEQLNLWKKAIMDVKQNHNVSKNVYEIENMIDVSLLIIVQSLKRTENKGGFTKIN